jgi:large subunit ribosomal protein L5
MDTAQLKKFYAESIAPALKEQFNYSSSMQIPVLKKIVINQGLGDATQDKKIIDVAINEISTIAGQKAVATYSKKDIANFKLRKKMPIGVMVTLRSNYSLRRDGCRTDKGRTAVSHPCRATCFD